MGRAEVVVVVSAQAGRVRVLEDLVEEEEVVVDEAGEEQVPDDVVAEVEVGAHVAHVVEGEHEVELQQLHHLHHQDQH